MQPFLETKNLECSLCVWSHASVLGKSCWCTSLNCSESGSGDKSCSFSRIFSVASFICICCVCPVIPDSSSHICLFLVRLLQSINTMISVFPVLALGLMLRSPASDLVPCFSDAKQLFGSCNQAFLMLAEQVTSMASFLSARTLYVASISQP